MDHTEVMKRMMTERYLLNELTSEDREAFEEHLFDCPECVLDLRAASAFMAEAKAQLPRLTGVLRAPVFAFPRKSDASHSWWHHWFRPAFAVPAFVTLLLVVGYQNLAVYPQLRAAANQPRLLPWAPLRGDVRGGASLAIAADRRHGVALPVDLPPQPSANAYSSYAFDLYDPQGKLAWTGLAAATGDVCDNQRLSLVIPGAMLRDGAYSVAVSGVAAHGERTAIGRYFFRLHLTN